MEADEGEEQQQEEQEEEGDRFEEEVRDGDI